MPFIKTRREVEEEEEEEDGQIVSLGYFRIERVRGRFVLFKHVNSSPGV